jgi:hypothetical protein
MTDEERIQNLKFTVSCYDTGEPIEITPRLDRFARRWARRWLRLYHSLPRRDHPFPNYWNTTFIVSYQVPSPQAPSSGPSGGNPA